VTDVAADGAPATTSPPHPPEPEPELQELLSALAEPASDATIIEIEITIF